MLSALLSIIDATLTLPGIAGIVLTVGMAVDANVLIYERIREELRHGLSPQAAIYAGYERAFSTILDANITTLIVAIILFAVGTGPVRGFAVTLSLGLLTSMLTGITYTRGIVNWYYGGRTVKKLSIGI
ncbi:protein-export membrane protein SecD [Legionella sainthelensi]|nr:protein-export membrane protein SecD [Legionella sainthelensi]